MPILLHTYYRSNGLYLPPCLHLPTAESLVYLGGRARLVAGDARLMVGGVAAVFLTPATDHAVYPANAFFGGLSIPVMSPAEELLLRRTYFVLPAAVPAPQGAHRRQARRAVGRAALDVLTGAAVQHAGVEATLRATGGVEEPAMSA